MNFDYFTFFASNLNKIGATKKQTKNFKNSPVETQELKKPKKCMWHSLRMPHLNDRNVVTFFKNILLSA